MYLLKPENPELTFVKTAEYGLVLKSHLDAFGRGIATQQFV